MSGNLEKTDRGQVLFKQTENRGLDYAPLTKGRMLFAPSREIQRGHISREGANQQNQNTGRFRPAESDAPPSTDNNSNNIFHNILDS